MVYTRETFKNRKEIAVGIINISKYPNIQGYNPLRLLHKKMGCLHPAIDIHHNYSLQVILTQQAVRKDKGQTCRTQNRLIHHQSSIQCILSITRNFYFRKRQVFGRFPKFQTFSDKFHFLSFKSTRSCPPS